MYHRSPPRRGPSAAPTQYGFRPREWAGQPLGLILSAYREAYGKSIEEAAQDLCIRRAHIRALEDGAYDNLPEASYAAGFVRSYAKYLGLPPEDMVSRFRETYRNQNQGQGLHRSTETLSPVRTVAYSPRWPSFAVLAIAAILLGTSYMVMAAYTTATNPVSQAQVAEVPVEFVGIAGDASVDAADDLIVNPQPDNSTPLTSFEGINIEIHIEDPAAAPLGEDLENLAIIETIDISAAQDQVVVYGVAVPRTRPDVGDLEPLALTAADQQFRVVVQAVGRAHLTLVDHATGQSFLRSEYQRGDEYLVPDDKIIRLMSQDIDRLHIIMDGVTYRVAPAIAALNEPLVLDPDVLPLTSQLIPVEDLN